MSRSLVVRIVVFCGIVGAWVGIRVLPGFWARRTAQQVASDVAHDVARDAAHKVADDVLRDVARQVAADVLRNMSSTRPATASADATVIDRAGYTITLPGNCTVDLPEAGVDRNRLTTVNLPNHGGLIIVAIEDKALAPPQFDKMIAALQGKLEGCSSVKSNAFDRAKAARSTAFSGTAKGERFTYEIAQLEGQQKACLVIVEYPDESSAASVELAQKALATFQIKE